MNLSDNHTMWIWSGSNPKEDEYGEFVDFFTYESGTITLQISADSNYAAYINGELAAWGQYADFPYDKIYDEVNVTAFCQKGENTLRVTVRHEGVNSACRISDGAGLIFSVFENEKEIAFSDEDTLSSLSSEYTSYIVACHQFWSYYKLILHK